MVRARSWSTTRKLAFLSLAVCGGHVLRSLLIGYAGYHFLLWTLFLAWIPSWLGLAIVTDFVHLLGSAPGEMLLDAATIASFAALGMALGLLSLGRVHTVVARRLGERLGWAFVGTVFVLTGAGVWMGRVLRWNSWDVVTHPLPLLQRTFASLLKPWDHLPSVGFTLLFALGLFVLYERFVRNPRAPMRSSRRLR